MSRSAASDETLDAWIALPADDLRTIEEFAADEPDPEFAKKFAAEVQKRAIRIGGTIVGQYVTTSVSTNFYDPGLPWREMPSARLLTVMGEFKGKVTRFRVSPDVAEELEIERRTDVRTGGFLFGQGRPMFRGIPIDVDAEGTDIVCAE